MELTVRVGRVEDQLEQLTSAVTQLAAAQLRTEQRVEDLAAAQSRTEQRVESLVAQMEKLAAAQTRTEEQLGTLLAWQAGERGRREGEAYERHTARSGWRRVEQTRCRW